jgi:hypothetical protein
MDRGHQGGFHIVPERVLLCACVVEFSLMFCFPQHFLVSHFSFDS